MTNNMRFAGLLLLFTLPLFAQGVFDHPLWTNDEGHVAEIGREMFKSGDVIVPYLSGEPFVEKPPLCFIAMCISYQFFGITPGAARLPSAVFGFLTALATYFIAAQLGNKRQGLIAAVVLASTSMIFRFSHWCTVDAATCCFSSLSFMTFLVSYRSDTKKRSWYLLFYTAIALAFMSKGLIAPVMIGVAVLSLLLWNRDLREISRMHIWAGVMITVAFTGPWLYLLWDVGGWDLFRNFAIDNNIGRFFLTVSSQYPEHTRGPFYYFTDFLGNFLPWTPIFIPALAWSFRQTSGPDSTPRTFYRFLFAGLVVNIIVSSFSSTKRGVYLLPLYPFAALMVGGWLDSLLSGRAPVRWERICIWFQVVLLALAPVILLGIGIHGHALPPVEATLLATAFLTLAGAGLSALRRGKLLLTTATFGVQTVLTYTIVVWLIFPIISPYKHYTPFFDRLQAVTRQDDIVTMYKNVGESNLGQACISMDRQFAVIHNIDHAISLLKSNGKRFILVIEDGPDFDIIAQSLGNQLKTVYSQSLGNHFRPGRGRAIYCLSNK